jgi:hypothetical protein
MDDFDAEMYADLDDLKISDRAERGAFDRAARVGIAEEFATAPTASTKHMSPEDRFIRNIEAITMQLVNEESEDIEINDVRQMISKIQARQIYVGDKNPLAFILGYMAAKSDDNRIDDERVRYVIDEVLPKMVEEDVGGVEPEDVIRYMRFCHSFL